jgi:hypothetical protein
VKTPSFPLPIFTWSSTISCIAFPCRFFAF